MATTTTFTASKQNNHYRVIVYFIVGLFLIASLFLILPFRSNSSNSFQHFFAQNAPTKSNAILYIPNSYLTYLIKKLVLNTSANIYDKNEYDFYDLSYSNTLSTKKTFKLTLIKKNSHLEGLSESEKKRKDNIESFYSLVNMQKKDIDLSYLNNQISIKTLDINNNEIEIYKSGFSDLLIKLSDASFAYEFQGETITTFYNNSIVVSYSKDATLVNDVAKYLDGQVMYQNLGISAIFPFEFLNLFTSQPKNQLYFKTGSTTFGDLKLKKVNLVTLPNNKVKATFIIDNKNFPAILTATSIFNKNSNTLEAIQNYTYDRANLSQLQINQMELFIRKAKVYGNDIINSPIVPRIEGDTVTFSSYNLNHKVAANGGNTSYFKENIISTIDLYF